MTHITMPRGFNDHFYFAQKYGETDCVVKQLTLSFMNGEWQYDTLEVHKINEGTVIALEMNPDNRDYTDSIYTNNNMLREKRKDVNVLNEIFIVDDKENLFHIKQKAEDESGPRYSIIDEKDLSPSRELAQELSRHKLKSFARLTITKRCITLNDQNYNFFNGHSWPLDVSIKESDAENNEEEENDEDEQN